MLPLRDTLREVTIEKQPTARAESQPSNSKTALLSPEGKSPFHSRTAQRCLSTLTSQTPSVSAPAPAASRPALPALTQREEAAAGHAAPQLFRMTPIQRAWRVEGGRDERPNSAICNHLNWL